MHAAAVMPRARVCGGGSGDRDSYSDWCAAATEEESRMPWHHA